MPRRLRRSLGSALAGAFALLPLAAQAGTLADLGYRQGVSLLGPQSAATAYFPLPVGATAATLTLHLAASGMLDRHSSVTVLIEGTPIATVPLAQSDAAITVPVPPSLLGAGFLGVTFAADQRIADGPDCGDDSAALWTRIEPATALDVQAPPPQGVGAVWRALGQPLTIALPDKPTPADLETATVLATALVERGVAPYFGHDANAAIRIDPQAGALAVSNAPAGTDRASLVVPSPAAARALVAADAALRRPVTTGAAGTPLPQAAPGDHITFAEAGLFPAALSVTRSASMDIPLPAGAVPAGRHVASLVLDGGGEAIPPGESEVVSVTVGDDVLWSQAFRGAPALAGVRVDLPPQLVNSGARPRLTVARLGNHPACALEVPLHFRLSDASGFVLADGGPTPRRFAAFAAAGGAPMPVLLGVPAERAAPALPLLAELLAAAGAKPGMVSLATAGGSAPAQPFILLADQAGAEVGSAPIPDPAASIGFDLPEQGSHVTLPAGAPISVLQLVRSKDAIPGLWLRPGPAASLMQAALPGDGNVALYDGGARPVTFDTQPRVANAVPRASDLLSVVARDWQTEAIVVAWLLLLVLAVSVVVKRRRAGR